MVTPGVRVKVPLRSSQKNTTGFVVEVASHSSHAGALVPLGDVVSAVPVLAPEIWRLARAVADRQAGNAADILRLAIPPRYVRAEKLWRDRGQPTAVPAIEMQSLLEYSEDELEGLVAPGSRWALTTPWGLTTALLESPDLGGNRRRTACGTGSRGGGIQRHRCS